MRTRKLQYQVFHIEMIRNLGTYSSFFVVFAYAHHATVLSICFRNFKISSNVSMLFFFLNSLSKFEVIHVIQLK